MTARRQKADGALVGVPQHDWGDDPTEAVIGEFRRLAGEMRVIVTEARTFAGREVASRVVAELPRAVDRLLARRQQRFIWLVGGGSVFAAAIVTFGLNWWFQPPATICMDQNGGRFCGAWVVAEHRK